MEESTENPCDECIEQVFVLVPLLLLLLAKLLINKSFSMYCQRAARCLSFYRAYFANFRVTWQWNNNSKKCWHLMNNTLLFTCSLALLLLSLFARAYALKLLLRFHRVCMVQLLVEGVSLQILHGKLWQGCHLTSMAPEGVSVSPIRSLFCARALCAYACLRCVGTFVCQILFIIQHNTNLTSINFPHSVLFALPKIERKFYCPAMCPGALYAKYTPNE